MFCLICGSVSAFASSETISFRHLGVEDGLSNNYITAIAQDRKGCIWVGTESGLNQFDGYNFTVFNRYNSRLNQHSVGTLFYDSKTDILWIGCKHGGLYSLNCSTYEIKGVLNTERAVTTNTYIAQREEGGFWMFPSQGNITYYYKGKTHFLDIKADNPRQEYSMLDDSHGHLFIGYSHGGLAIIDLKKRTRKRYKPNSNDPNSLPGERVYCFCKDHLGNIWIGTNSGLALYNSAKDNFTVFRHKQGNPASLLSDHVMGIAEVDENSLWICSDVGGISIIDLQDIVANGVSGLKFRNIRAGFKSGDLSSANVRSAMQDASGNVWVGNYGNGLDIKSRNKAPFSTLPYYGAGTERNKSVWGLYVDDDDNVWAGGKSEVVIFDKNGIQKTIDISAQLERAYAQVNALCRTDDDGMLIGVFDDGLFRYDLRTGAIKRLPLRKKFQDIYRMYKDKDGTIWIGTEDGLYCYADGKLTISDAINTQLEHPYIYGISRDNQGRLWTGMAYGGIAVFDNSGKLWKRLSITNGLLTDIVNYMYKDTKGRIWAATGDGLLMFPDTRNPTKWKVYKPAGKDMFVRGINEDKYGNIWISSNNVISMLDERKGVFYNYDFHDGVPRGNFIEGSSCQDSQGNLYFGSLGGICKFSPDGLLAPRDAPSVHIIACKSLSQFDNGQNTEAVIPLSDKGLVVDYDENSFTVSFSVADYSLSSQTEYAYKIEGLDNEWTNTNGENKITIFNLDYGDYTLLVKARLKNQPWNEKHTARLAIRVNPPLWLSWWAKGIYLIAIAGAAFWLIKRYERRLKAHAVMEAEKKRLAAEQEINNERLRFYTNVTHELRTPLTLILGPLEDLVNEKQPPSDWSKRITTIHDSASRLLRTVNQLLDFRKTETRNRQLTVSKGDIGQLVTEIGLRFKELNRNKNLEINIVINTADTLVYFDREIITTILENLLGNALKYTPQGSVSLLLRTVSQGGAFFSEISVNDTGFGISEEALPHIFERYYQADGAHKVSGTGIGLALVKSMAELHEAEITVESAVGRGTSFRLLLRNDNTYPNALHKEADSAERQERPALLALKAETDTEDKASAVPLMLIVEDNEDILQYVADSFSSNFRILTAKNGKDGWEKALASIPDIIISDIMMPIMDGITMCMNVKEDMRTSHIPVILLTAKDTITDKETGYNSGADSYITKPFSAKLLRSRVNNLLESRRRLAKMIAGRTVMPLAEVSQDSRYSGEMPELNDVSRDFLNRLNSLIEEKIVDSELDVNFLARELGMSYSSLYRKIKGLTGMTTVEIIRKVRLRHALQLIKKGYNVSNAAYDSGFSDLDYFRAWFKKEYGATPSRYQRKGKA